MAEQQIDKDSFDAALVPGFREAVARKYADLARAHKRPLQTNDGTEVDERLVSEHRPCPLCKESEDTPALVDKEGVELVSCHNCGFYYSRKVLSDDFDRKIYSNSEFQRQYLELKNDDHYHDLERKKSTYIISVASRYAGHNGRMLEIGSGAGRLLQAAAEIGLTGIGIEPNPVFAQLSQTEGFEILEGFFPEVLLEKEYGSFQIVAMLDVLEHAPDPIGFLKMATRYLSKDGVVAVQVPNYDSLLVRLEGKDSSVVCRGHWNYFTPHSLGVTARKAGLEVKFIETIISEIDRVQSFKWVDIERCCLETCGESPPRSFNTAWLHSHGMGYKVLAYLSYP